MTPITVPDLTQATLEGTGVFDVLMRANKAHLEAEFTKGRIKGSEYSTVYLGSVTQVMQTALQFLLTKEKSRLENELLEKQALLVAQQTANAVLEGAVLVAQECKLRAEFDLTTASILKTNQETALLSQKVATERAQVTALGVDDNSVLGKQKTLYQAQTDGFKRDAEQKAAKLMADTWNVRRTTDEATVADGTNQLNDAAVGRAIGKLLTGIGA
jgi:hypothetical protein